MGNPLLRKKSEEVPLHDIDSLGIQSLIDNLIDTMHHFEGAGIAAPQIGVLKRIFVMEMSNANARYPEKEPFPLVVAINPRLEFISSEEVDSWEGCLSIPKIRGRLKRRVEVKLTAHDRSGAIFSDVLNGFAAIVAQHETDHLNGELFIDHMESMESLSFWDEYQTFWKPT